VTDRVVLLWIKGRDAIEELTMTVLSQMLEILGGRLNGL